MWIKLKTLMAGPQGVHQPGAVVDLSDEQGQQLVDTGQADKSTAPRTSPPSLRSPLLTGEGGKKEKATSKQAQKRETRGAKANG
jgi:hypothetical protein